MNPWYTTIYSGGIAISDGMFRVMRKDGLAARLLRAAGSIIGVLSGPFIIASVLGIFAWSFHYCLWVISGKDVPWYVDLVCGLLVGSFTVPLSIVFWLLRLCGVEAPFFP